MEIVNCSKSHKVSLAQLGDRTQVPVSRFQSLSFSWLLTIFIYICIYYSKQLKRTYLNECFLDIVDIKPANMEELTEVITAAEFHPNSCNTFVYSSSKGTIRLCDMRASALCDRHSKCEFYLPSLLIFISFSFLSV